MKKLVFLLIVAFAFTGCVTTDPTYTNIGKLSYQSKQYQSSQDLSDLSLAIAKPEIKINITLSRTLKSALRKRIEANACALAGYLSEEMKKALIAQGFTVTDTFDSINSMTFTQKRNTSALFTAFIKFDIDENSMTSMDSQKGPISAEGELTAKAKLQIATIEPLSGEIVWLKTVPVGDISTNLMYPYYPRLNATESIIPNELLDSTNAMDSMFVNSSVSIVNAINKFVDVQEFQFLNTDIKKLKKIKRY